MHGVQYAAAAVNPPHPASLARRLLATSIDIGAAVVIAGAITGPFAGVVVDHDTVAHLIDRFGLMALVPAYLAVEAVTAGTVGK